MSRHHVPARPGGWALVVPVKVLARAKSRLAGLDGDRRAALALAMAADAVAAASASPAVGQVVVVTGDPRARAELGGPGVVVVADEPDAGLNPALRLGAAYAARHWPGWGRAGMAADLPALRPAELDRALAAAAGPAGAYVPDADGTGTTLYAAPPGGAFRPQFGPGSRAAHAALGAAEIGLPGLDGLRRDVDTLDDLRRAAEIGLGPRTRAVAAPLLAG